ncbi:MAG: SpoIID/LytB domain-containing protein [Desulfobacterales bacterium]|nr:SpoIID/LytB domain-containing protein [Desulfobacterales bacterium]
MNKVVLILILFLLPINSYGQNNHVRVRILERYHPKKVFISYPESIFEEIKVNLKSKLPVTFNTPSIYTLKIPEINFKRQYFGTIAIYRNEKSELTIVNIVPLEKYVISVVLSELGYKEAEAMCAQSVISRTWALSHIRPEKKWDFNDLTISQVYKGITDYDEKALNRISQTFGKVLTFDNRFAEIFFHAKCSENIYSAYEVWGKDIKYLRNKRSNIKDPYIWKTMIERKKLGKIFSVQKSNYILSKKNGRLYILAGKSMYPIDRFRLMVNRELGWRTLKSIDFKIKAEGDFIYFTGKGHGHLVGFCQEGAVAMAKNGLSYQDILNYYFPGCAIEDVP